MKFTHLWSNHAGTQIPKHYHPHVLERRIRAFWDANAIKQKTVRKTNDGKPFFLLDGPPYVSGEPHLGHAWNKVLKDIIIRYYTSKGFHVRRQPGWDMHGLPIEVETEKRLSINVKKKIQDLGVNKFIEECKRLALKYKEIFEKELKELSIWMDWDDPYLTIKNDWIESEWSAVKRLWEAGLLYRDQKVMHWCKRCQTALAEHEVEYKEQRDPSVYVKLPLTQLNNDYVLVWTTTPWTLPANMAVLIHPDATYVKVKVNDEFWWMAEERVDAVSEEVNFKEYHIVAKKKGREMEGFKYLPPFLEEYEKQEAVDAKEQVHRLITDQEVDLSEGTGCVHLAPGHGMEDFEVGRRHDLPIYSPVNSSGEYTEGKWKGTEVTRANSKIIEYLEEKGFIVASGTITHRYPICWRCKTPLLFRATEQWFVHVEPLKDELVRRNQENVEWIPSWTQERFLNGIQQVGDWCISRQRYWNAPMPLWRCETCDHKEFLGSQEELQEKAIEPFEEVINLHRPFVDKLKLQCPNCGGKMTRTTDVLDVWFDSGIASWASLDYPGSKNQFKKFWPSELIIEGRDQLLKWFYVQQILGLVLFDQIPYRRVVMHGFFLDSEGREMHKSLGNVIPPKDVRSKYGRDTFRMYLASASLGTDKKFIEKEIDQIEASLRILWNLFYLITRYMEMDDFTLDSLPMKQVKRAQTPADEWIVSHTKKIVSNLEQHLTDMAFPKAIEELLNYCTDDLSRWYGKLVRRRLWIEEESLKKQAVYLTFFKVCKLFLPVLGFFAPHLAEFLYQFTVRGIDHNAPVSVHLLDFPSSKGRNRKLERYMDIVREITRAGLAARERSNIKQRWPLQKAVIDTPDQEVKKAVRSLEGILKNMLNVKSIQVRQIEQRIKSYPSFKALGPKYKEKTDRIAEAIRNVDAKELKEHLETQGCYHLRLGGDTFKISESDVKFEVLPPQHYVSEPIPGGYIFLHTQRGKQLKAEGYAMDLVRRIQEMRKEMDLDMQEQINVEISTSAQEELKIELIAEEWSKYITHETRAKELSFTASLTQTPDYVKEWNIDGESLKIGIQTRT